MWTGWLNSLQEHFWVKCVNTCLFVCLFLACQPPSGPGPPHSRGFLDHIQRLITDVRVSVDEWSARRRDLYLTTHNTHNRQTSMPPVGFEPTISAGEQLQTYTLDRAATGTGCWYLYWSIFQSRPFRHWYSFDTIRKPSDIANKCIKFLGYLVSGICPSSKCQTMQIFRN